MARCYSYFAILYKIGNKENKEKAKQALLNTYYTLKKNEMGYIFVSQFSSEKKHSPPSQQAFIDYFIAEHYYKQKQYIDALHHYERIPQENSGQLAAEALYKIALVHFEQGNMTQAESSALQAATQHSSYEEWVIASYILLGDIYTRQGDYFNAKASYKSIIDNTTIPHLATEAKEKYLQIIDKEVAQKQSEEATFRTLQKPLENALDTFIKIHKLPHNKDTPIHNGSTIPKDSTKMPILPIF